MNSIFPEYKNGSSSCFSGRSAILLDLDGTLYHEEHPLPGAVDLLKKLQAEEINYACLSNSTSSSARVSARLKRMGVEVEERRIYTAGQAAVDYVMEKWGPRPRVFNLATEGVRTMLEGRVQWVEDGAEECDAIVIGAPANVYAKEDRQRAALVLARRGVAMVGICADRVYPSGRGLEFGVGALSAMLAYGSGREVIFLGKPQAVFFQQLCHRIGAVPAGCILIGDNVESDVAGAKAVGMKTILTLTGVTHREDLPKLKEEHQPDYVVEGLMELL